jgi:regulatory protein
VKNYELSAYEKVYSKILNFVSYRPRSEKEISNKLKYYLRLEKIAADEKSKIEDEVVSKLAVDGYVNDLKAVGQFLDSFLYSPKRKSLRSLKESLMRKGFSTRAIEEVFSKVPEDSENEKVLADAKKKLRSLYKEKPIARKTKLKSFLYRKGYRSEVINSVVDSLL